MTTQVNETNPVQSMFQLTVTSPLIFIFWLPEADGIKSLWVPLQINELALFYYKSELLYSIFK
jgi:hypothetical protein